MREITADELHAIMPLAGRRVELFLPFINPALSEFYINTAERQRQFIAQVAHESASLVYVRELASGAAYDTGKLAAALGNTPEADGDGQKYKGRGLIQITGHANYAACSSALFGDDRLLGSPEILEQPEFAVRSAAWFWNKHGLNELADTKNLLQITKVINGGINGLQDRTNFYNKACEVIHDPDWS